MARSSSALVLKIAKLFGLVTAVVAFGVYIKNAFLILVRPAILDFYHAAQYLWQVAAVLDGRTIKTLLSWNSYDISCVRHALEPRSRTLTHRYPRG